MTYRAAIRILDQVREGQDYPLTAINRALEMTGDL